MKKEEIKDFLEKSDNIKESILYLLSHFFPDDIKSELVKSEHYPLYADVLREIKSDIKNEIQVISKSSIINTPQRESITLKTCFDYTIEMFNSDPYGFVSTGESIDSDKEITLCLLDLIRVWNQNFYMSEKLTFFQYLENGGWDKLMYHYHKTMTRDENK